MEHGFGVQVRAAGTQSAGMRVCVSIAEPVSSLFIIGDYLLQCSHEEPCETQELILCWFAILDALSCLTC